LSIGRKACEKKNGTCCSRFPKGSFFFSKKKSALAPRFAKAFNIFRVKTHTGRYRLSYNIQAEKLQEVSKRELKTYPWEILLATCSRSLFG